MLFREVIVVYSENRTIHTNILCVEIESFIVKESGTVINVLLRFEAPWLLYVPPALKCTFI
jgi:hypothetical protein